MCGIVGVLLGSSDLGASAAADIHDALYLLQHRGQDACGIATCASGGRIYQCKGNGLAAKVFQEGQRVSQLPGSFGVGHLRYPTAGSSANAEAQPFYVNSPYGLAFSHNGNLINAPALKKYLDQVAHRHINTDSDSELMLNVYADSLQETGKARVNAEDCFSALTRTYAKCQGAWACVTMIAGFGLIAFRDPYGIRPLVMGSRTLSKESGTDYMIASESVALKFFGCSDSSIIDIKPGEAVLIEKGQAPRFHQVQKPIAYATDIFEYVYFSRPDSVIDGISVASSRLNMGRKLGETIKAKLGSEALDMIDAVVPIPETSNTSAHSVAEVLNKKVVTGFIRNRYICTFIMPEQKLRRTGVRRKLNAMRSEFEGKNVLLIDDSIVRGTTSKEIVQMAREAGAKKVFFASCAPPITHAHIYGIDLASSSELIAFDKTAEDIAKEIDADAVIYQTLEDLQAAIAELSPRANDRYEDGVFSGKYITPVDDGYIEHLERIRGQRMQMKIEEKARQSVLNGSADQEQMRIVQSGTQLSKSGRVLPVGVEGSAETDSLLRRRAEGERINGHSTGRSMDTQDIALYNVNDAA